MPHYYLGGLDLSDNEIKAIHPQAGLSNFYIVNLSNNKLTCLPDGFISMPWEVNLSGNELSTLQPDVYVSSDVDLTSNPMQCSSICWLKLKQMAGSFSSDVSCVDGINWDTWDGLDDNGQCVIPLFPGCPLPSPIPTSPSQCPSECPGRKDVLIFCYSCCLFSSKDNKIIHPILYVNGKTFSSQHHLQTWWKGKHITCMKSNMIVISRKASRTPCLFRNYILGVTALDNFWMHTLFFHECFSDTNQQIIWKHTDHTQFIWLFILEQPAFHPFSNLCPLCPLFLVCFLVPAFFHHHISHVSLCVSLKLFVAVFLVLLLCLEAEIHEEKTGCFFTTIKKNSYCIWYNPILSDKKSPEFPCRRNIGEFLPAQRSLMPSDTCFHFQMLMHTHQNKPVPVDMVMTLAWWWH